MPSSASLPSRFPPTTSPRISSGRGRMPILLFEMTAKYGLPYFQNFLNSESGTPNGAHPCVAVSNLIFASCLNGGNGLFGSAEQTGSVGVVTLNAARLGYICRGSERNLHAQIDRLMDGLRESGNSSARSFRDTWTRGYFPTLSAYSAPSEIIFRLFGNQRGAMNASEIFRAALRISPHLGEKNLPCACLITCGNA